MRRIFILVLCLIFLSGCALRTVAHRVKNLDFQEENQPIRTIRIVLVADNKTEIETWKEAVRSASDLMEIQTGIRVKLTEIILRNKVFSSKRGRVLDELAYTTFYERNLKHGKDFDFAIGTGNYSFVEKLKMATFLPVWIGLVDDNICRCYIIARKPNTRIIAHEIYHGFMMDLEHSGPGLMAGMILELIPGIPLSAPYLSSDARSSILKNKWREFYKLPPNIKTRGADKITIFTRLIVGKEALLP